MKKLSLLCVLFGALLLYSLPALGDTYVSGPVSGTWTAALSPYVALGNIEVPNGLSLNIQPGVQVLFAGSYKFIVHGQLNALGTTGDSIRFNRQFTSYNWRGIFFETTSAPGELAYCIIENGYAQGTIGTVGSKGGGVHVLGSTVNIRNCRFTSNFADGKGGAIYLNFANAEIADNLITNNTCYEDGGGFFIDNCSPYIHDNEVKNNVADNGAGFYFSLSNGVIASNNIHHNNASAGNGGGFFLGQSSPSIQINKINNNSSSSSYGTGIYCVLNSSPMIVYNEICFNNYTAIYCVNNSNPLINNCTFFSNNSYIIRTATNSNPSGTNNIMIASPYTFYIGTGCSVNMTYSDIQIPWPGQGNLNNLAPNFVNSFAGDFNLMPYSICIDHGNPSSPLDPDGTIADIGAHYFNQNQPQGTCSVIATPLGAPIVLPPQGGTVWFTVLVQNTPTFFNLFDGWINLQQPDLQIVPLLNRGNLYLPAGGNLARTLSMTINSTAMPGTYTVQCYVGDYPANIEDWDSFTFMKSATEGDLGSEPPVVTITDGEVTETVPLLSSALPAETKLLGHYPEPFNPETAFSYQLSAFSHVNLKVYDTAGRLVSTVVNGWGDAGQHEVTFDGSGLASGVYLYTLQAGDYHTSGKMTLLK